MLVAQRVLGWADSALLSIAFVGTGAISELNRKYLRKRTATDVISFALKNPVGGSAVVGDIYICPAAAADAVGNSADLCEELIRLVVHGTLHVLGYDHPESAARTRSRMWLLQERYVTRFLA